MRSNARRRTHNASIKSRLHTLERGLAASLKSGKQEEAQKAYKALSSAMDKAAKSRVIPKGRASRKKSRLAAALRRKV